MDKKIKVLWTNNDLEFRPKEFDNFCKKKGSLRYHIVAYTPRQNKIAEKLNRTLLEKTRCILINNNLPKLFGQKLLTQQLNNKVSKLSN